MINNTIIVKKTKPIQPGHSPIHLTASFFNLSSNLSSDLSGVRQHGISASECSVFPQNSASCSQI